MAWLSTMITALVVATNVLMCTCGTPTFYIQEVPACELEGAYISIESLGKESEFLESPDIKRLRTRKAHESDAMKSTWPKMRIGCTQTRAGPVATFESVQFPHFYLHAITEESKIVLEWKEFFKSPTSSTSPSALFKIFTVNNHDKISEVVIQSVRYGNSGAGFLTAGAPDDPVVYVTNLAYGNVATHWKIHIGTMYDDYEPIFRHTNHGSETEKNKVTLGSGMSTGKVDTTSGVKERTLEASANFGFGILKSAKIGGKLFHRDAWKSTKSRSFSEFKQVEISVTTPPGKTSEVSELVGHYDEFEFRNGAYQVTECDNQTPHTIRGLLSDENQSNQVMSTSCMITYGLVANQRSASQS